jgi:hypothetical protein
LNCLGGIVRVVHKLRTWWTSNVGSQSPKALTPDTRRGKCEGVKGCSEKSDRHEGLWVKVSRAREDGNKCMLTLPWGDPQGSLFIGVIRGVGNNIQTAPLTVPFTLSV